MENNTITQKFFVRIDDGNRKIINRQNLKENLLFVCFFGPFGALNTSCEHNIDILSP